jgi:DNA-binding transcriptional LysR family regulator
MVPADPLQGAIAYERVFTTLDYVYAGLNHKLASSRATIPLEELVEQRWVALDTPHAQIYFNRFFSSAGAGNPRQVFRSDSLAMLRSMIESGDWLGIMPAEYMKKSDARSLRVKGLPLVRACGLLTRADIPLRPIVAEFGSVMRTEMLRLQHPRASLPVG